MTLIDHAISRARTVLSVLALLLLAGAYAYADIAKESDPDINIPILYVSMALEGIAPADAERLLVRPMEQELATIEGVDEMRATAYQGGANVVLEFTAGFDVDAALTDVRAAVDKAKAELPADAEEPVVEEVNLSLRPVLVVTLSGPVPERTLLRLARELQDTLEAIPSVLEATIAGDREEVVEVQVAPELVEAYGLAGEELVAFFGRSNRLVAAGRQERAAGGFAVEVPGLFETPADVAAMPLVVAGDSAVTVADIAQVRPTFRDPESFARMGGQAAIGLNVVKRTGENVLDTIAAVRAAVAQESARWPASVRVTFTQDASEQIRTMLADLQNNTISAIVLVMVVMLWALGPRAAGLVGVAVPGSLLTGILILYLSGLTVNVVVLFALILSVGMLVDGAIVVVEYADRKMAEGARRREAYAAAAGRMAMPIIASTATTLAAFFPLLFWPDTVGQFMRYMPLTLIAVLSASLAMALIFVPVLGTLLGRPGAGAQQTPPDESAMVRRYTGFLRAALARPFLILATAVALMIGVQGAYYASGLGVEFFPKIEPETASVLVHARGNLSVWEKDALVAEVEAHVLDAPGIEAVYTQSGKVGQAGRGGPDAVAADTVGNILIQFDDWDARPPANDILEGIRAATAGISGIRVETREDRRGPQSGKDVQIQLASLYPDRLPAMVALVRRALAEVGDFRDVEDSRPLPGIDWQMAVDRAQAAKFGVDVATVGYYVRMVTNGLIVGDYRPDGATDEVDILLRHGPADRTLERLQAIKIPTDAGPVPVASFVTRTPAPATGQIDRVDQRRAITVAADLPEGVNTSAKVAELRAWLDAHADEVDALVAVDFRGDDERQRDSQAFLVKAFAVALFIMAVILVTQFNSFSSAAFILFAVVMSTAGVIIGLLVTQQPFGVIMSGVGVIALAGIVVNNNIILIDTFDTLRARWPDLPVREVIVRTGAQRLRPVLLTTVTTVVGLLPMVLQVNIDFFGREVSVGAPSTQWWVQLATAIVFGLSFATALTLVVTPCALMARHKARVMAARWWGRGRESCYSQT
jgi:multidrug efflux pump